VPSKGGWDLGGFYSPPRTPPGGVGVRFPVPTAGSRPVRVCVVPGATQRYWKVPYACARRAPGRLRVVFLSSYLSLGISNQSKGCERAGFR
jgi:hypothetical protein